MSETNEQTPHDQDTAGAGPNSEPEEGSTTEQTLTAQSADDSRRRHAESLQQLLPDKRIRAVEFLQTELRESAEDFRAAIAADPDAWWARPKGASGNYPGMSFHTNGGQYVRNALRQHGMDEAWFGVGNLDDVYIGLIELAIMGENYYADVAPLP